MRKISFGVAALLLVPLCVVSQERTEKTSFPAPFTVRIPMRDGKTLAADVFLPDEEGKHPTILIMTPYNRKLLAAAIPAAAARSPLLDRRHYAFVVVDWRGFFGSKAAAAGKVSAKQRGIDGYDTVEWIAKQDWSNGKVGMWGPSALGKVQFLTAVQQPPHLVCICPLVAHHPHYYSRYYYGGVYKTNHNEILERVGFTGATDMVREHPTYDRFWRWLESPTFNAYSRINVPVLVIGGWFDCDTDNVLRTFREIRRYGGPVARKNTKILIGPWTHMDAASGKSKQGELDFPAAAEVSQKEARRFFDYYLRGAKDNGYDRRPVVSYFQMGEGKWEKSEDWPPKGVEEVLYYLREKGALSKEAPEGESEPDTFKYDPKDPSPTAGGMTICKSWDKDAPKLPAGPMDQRKKVESRKDVLVYSSDVLRKNVAVKGNVKVKLFVFSDRVDTDFAVRLCDVRPDGRSMLVTDGIRRMKFRRSFEKPEPMKPGETYEVTVTLAVTAHTFLKGHRIRLIVGSSNYPRFDRNPNNGKDFYKEAEALPATNGVRHDAAHPSVLILPAAAAAREDPRERIARALYARLEKECIEKGWRKVVVEVGGLRRKLLWRGPKGVWKNGAIVALHGGGGTCSNWGSGPRSLCEPMWRFVDLAVAEGFAVFALDSTDGLVADEKGRSCGKRWDCLARKKGDNIDLPFIKTVLEKTIPGLRPAGSAEEIFMTGISNGGFMTILAATHFPEMIAAFAPVSAGDPYGTYFDMGTHPKRERYKAPGVFRDSETNEPINRPGAARAERYPHESKWPETGEARKPPFKQFHHRQDGACDFSCMEKARRTLVEHGYKDDGAFVLKDHGGRSVLKHFWRKEYNRPMIDFFLKCRKK